MSGCTQKEEGASDAHAGGDAAARGNVDALPESFISTAQWVARHADIKQRFEKIRNEFEQRCSSCSGSEASLKPAMDKSGKAPSGSRRLSESACRHDSPFYNEVPSNCCEESDTHRGQQGSGVCPQKSSIRSAGEDYLDWMYTQKPPGSSGRSRAAAVPLRSAMERRTDPDSSDFRRPVLQSSDTPLRASSADLDARGFEAAAAALSPEALAVKQRKGSCVFTFDAQEGDDDSRTKLPRSASFTTDCHLPAEHYAAVHRSPSQPVAKDLDTPGSRDAQKPLPGLQVNRVKKVGSLRCFGTMSLEDQACQANSVDSLPGGSCESNNTLMDATEGGREQLQCLPEVKSPRIQRRPAVPPLLQSPSPQRLLASPDISHPALSPGKLRPAVLHPEFRSIMSQLGRSVLPVNEDGSSDSGRACNSCALAADSSQSTPTTADDGAVDEGLGLSSSFGGQVPACAGGEQYLHAPPADFPLLQACEDGSGASVKKKGGKRSHTHPPSTKAADCIYIPEAKARDTNGFSHVREHNPDCGARGSPAKPCDADCQLPPPDSLYNSLDDVDAGCAGSHLPSESVVAANAPLSTAAVQSACAAGTKFKRVKSDPFPDTRSLAATACDSTSGEIAGLAAGLERSPSDATHERSRSASAGQQSSTGPLAEAGASTDFASSDGSEVSMVSAGKGAHEQRMHIVNEIIEKEEIYVANLEQVSQAVSQLKEQDILDSSTVDKIFCNIRLPESRVHHKIFLESMRVVRGHWEPNVTTVGDRIVNMFSSQSVLENYMAYVGNCSKSKARLEQAFKTKPNFCKFNDAFRRSNVSRQDLRAVLSLPANHLISYRFFIERMLKYTPDVHPDNEKLLKARCVVLELLDKVGGQDSPDSAAEAERTLKKLEALLSVQDLALQPDRVYLRNDCVTIKPGKRECAYIWLFSDIVLITLVKGSRINTMSGKLSHPRRSSMTVLSPRGQEVIEKVPHKLWMRLSLEEVEIVMSPENEKRKCAKDMLEAENDFERLVLISNEADALLMQHEKLQKNVLELMDACNQRLAALRQRRDAIDMLSLQLLVSSSATNSESGLEITLTFESAEKRSNWEAMLSEAKINLEAALTDKLPPEFKDAIPITKTRSGMQFSCAAAVEGLAVRDVWICNSDSYVGHVCLLNLLPQPTVSMSTAVPSCTSRVLCICAVPAAASMQNRHGRLSRSHTGSSTTTAKAIVSAASSTETLLNEQAQDAVDEDFESDDEDGAADNDDAQTDDDGTSTVEDLCIHETTDLTKSLMWLGTEDGCIHIFNSEENLRTSRVRPIRIQHKASVLCIVFLEQSVFVSLSNGSVIVYRRSEAGGWDLDSTAEALSTGGSSSSTASMTLPAPVTRMLAVCGKLWCSYQNEIVVLDPNSLKAEISFAASTDRLRAVQSMVYSRHGIVAIATQGSCDVRLFHATTRKLLGDISIAAAVAQKLQGCDDIIRQHKAACLKITTLLTCKDSLWVGTSAGVILTMLLPKITSSMANSREYSITAPSITGLSVGHTGNVRFLLCADLPRIASDVTLRAHGMSDAVAESSAAVAAVCLPASGGPSVGTKMLVISGGDGYEVFSGGSLTVDGLSGVGSSDSVNHLLVWEV